MFFVLKNNVPRYVPITNLEHKFKVCISFAALYNSNKSPTTCNNFSVYYPDVFLEFNMFRAFSRSSSGPQWLQCSFCFYLRIVVIFVLCSWSGQPRTQPNYHHNAKVKPEAATAVVELLMMGGKTPETC